MSEWVVHGLVLKVRWRRCSKEGLEVGMEHHFGCSKKKGAVRILAAQLRRFVWGEVRRETRKSGEIQCRPFKGKKVLIHAPGTRCVMSSQKKRKKHKT